MCSKIKNSNFASKVKCQNNKCHKTLFFAWIMDVVHINIKCPKCGEHTIIKANKPTQNAN